MVINKGSLMVLFAGIAWGLSGVSGQYLMLHGVEVNLLTSLRLMISGSVLCVMAFMTQKEKMLRVLASPNILLNIFMFSILGLLMNQYTYMNAIKHTNAGTATVLQYLSPVLIMSVVAINEKRMPSVAEGLSIIFAILGTAVIATHGQLGSLAITPEGLVWGLISAITATLYVLMPARLIEKWGSLVVIGLAMIFSGSLFTVIVRPWRYNMDLTTGNSIALFGLIAIGTIFAYTFFLKGASLVGPVKGTLLAAVEPVASVLFAVVLLSEFFYPMDLIGMFFIMMAVLLISLRDFILLRRQKRLQDLS
ncbi:DMT family transporter [Streptococcus parauberis]|uniref:Membrane protein n=1 Tax=Streptococcus parauberis NCFD 2020 TaxID=873447 RepID=F1Z321_9STRE|nr:EamA family transporter [Streptococcus parauberis]EGE53693.1 membrane protein [Streptococcus parauberis NCFD 2020]